MSGDTLLAMFHPLLEVDWPAWYPELNPIEVGECNLEIAATFETLDLRASGNPLRRTIDRSCRRDESRLVVNRHAAWRA
jgi:hypothetical protein